MPLTDPASVAVLTSLTSGVWTDLGGVATPQEHGFDHLDVEWICDYRDTAKTAIQVAAAFPLGTRYRADDFWLRSGVPRRVGGNVWRFKAHYEGRISSGKPLSVRKQATQEVMSIDSLTFGEISGIPANVREANPSVQIGYVLVGSEPPTNLVGLAGTPAVAPSVRAGIWGALSAQRINFPSGWIFTDVDVDTIAGSDPSACWVNESWQFVQQWVPS